MPSFAKVPVVDVHRDNFHSFWPSILFACKNASFIALDAELSGLGPRKKLVAKDINERYKSVCEVAKTRAVLSLGISCFKYEESSRVLESRFAVQTYNITTLCDQDYIVEPAALQFLVEHGFDFNKQYSKGILYHTGPDKDVEKDGISIRNLFSEILMSCKPVVVHNGFIDMAFLYQHFYSILPASYSQFVVDLSEMYEGGLFDTKYLAEFSARMPSSYLEYVFRKCLRDNCSHSTRGERCIALNFQDYPDGSKFVEHHPCTIPGVNRGVETHQKICHLYSAFGFCKQSNCEDSHNLDIILDADDHRVEQKKKRRRRKRKKTQHGDQMEKNSEDTETSSSITLEMEITEAGEAARKLETGQGHTVTTKEEDGKKLETGQGHTVTTKEEDGKKLETGQGHTVTTKEEDEKKLETGQGHTVTTEENGSHAMIQGKENSKVLPRQHGSHRAGFDAFMTGFSLACIINEQGKFPTENEEVRLLKGFGMSSEANKLALTGKDIPMLIAKSSFAKSSQGHREKMKSLRSSVGR